MLFQCVGSSVPRPTDEELIDDAVFHQRKGKRFGSNGFREHLIDGKRDLALMDHAPQVRIGTFRQQGDVQIGLKVVEIVERDIFAGFHRGVRAHLHVRNKVL